MQRVLLIYDIENDRIRTKVADVCMDYGLDRTQYSAFTGQLSRNLQQELMLRLGNLLSDQRGLITLIPISNSDWKARLEIRYD